MAMRMEQENTRESLDWLRRRSPTERGYRRDQDRYNTMNCEELGTEMTAAMHSASELLNQRCSLRSCSFSRQESNEVESLAIASMRIAGISHVADQKLCLPEVLAAAEDYSFSSSEFRERFLASAVSGEARERFSKAFARMAELQGDIENLRGSVVDRRLLFPNNVEDPSVCPSPCQSCTTRHNSWIKGEEAFSFKCILNPGDPAPVAEGLQCSEPVLRNSVMHRIRSHLSESTDRQYKTWCEVQDWQDLAAQTLAISAHLTCGAKAIFAPIQTGEDMSEDLYATCVAKENGDAVPQNALNQLRQLDETVGNVVAPSNLAIFSVLMSKDITSTVGRLRQATRTSEGHHQVIGAHTGLDFSHAAEGGALGDHDVRLAYNHTHSSRWFGKHRFSLFGSCSRSIFSLAIGLFTGVIQILIGISYLVIMLFLGVIAGLVAGVTFATETIRGWLSSGDAAMVEGAEAAERVAGMASGWGVAIVVGGFAVGFGIWGIKNILTAAASPYDCSSGQLGHGENAICHPALRYGERYVKKCPSETHHDGEITFVCLRENRGVMTFHLPRIFGTVTHVETLNNGCAFFAE